MNKRLLLGIFVIGALLLAGCAPDTGTLVLQLTDQPNLDLEEVTVTISEVEVHRAGVGNETEADWDVVVDEPQTHDLLELRNVTALLGSAELPAARYTQIRLHIDDASVTVDGEEQALEIPSEVVRLVNPFVIEAGQTLTLTLDFDAQQSVTRTGQGRYILRPTITVLEG